MLAKDIVVGGLYTAKVDGNIVPVRVDAIRMVMGTNRDEKRWDVTNMKTGRKTTFRSAAKFRAPVNAAAVEADSKAKGRKALAEVFTPETIAAASGPVNTVSREHYGVSEADLDYAYGVHGGSRVGGETPEPQLPAKPVYRAPVWERCRRLEESPLWRRANQVQRTALAILVLPRKDPTDAEPAVPVAKATQRQALRNRWGWVLVYESVEGSPTVTVRRAYRGAPAGDLTLSVTDARRHYWKNLYSNSFELVGR